MLDRRLWAVAAGLLCVLAYLTIAEAQGPGGRVGRPEGGPMGMQIPLLLALDADGDGELSAKEIENATAALKTLDKDKNGKLSREEMFPAPGRFGGRGPGQGPGNDPAAMVSALMTYDKNADGKLSKDELPERLRPIMDRADANKDGFLDKAEVTEYAQRRGRNGPVVPDGGGPLRKGGRRNGQGGPPPGGDI